MTQLHVDYGYDPLERKMMDRNKRDRHMLKKNFTEGFYFLLLTPLSIA
jgi:hypothetical protein